MSVRPTPANRPESAWFICPTDGGLKAITVWRKLTVIIEQRWQKRFGHDLTRELSGALHATLKQLKQDLTDYLPILGYELS